MPIKLGIFCVNSMVSGPTNSRCSGTIGNDRGGTAFGSKHRKNRCIGLELAYKRWSLMIAEDRGQPEISGVTLGVTEDAPAELPPKLCSAQERWREKSVLTPQLKYFRTWVRFRVSI